MNSEPIQDFKLWETTEMALQNVMANFMCRYCQVDKKIIGISRCCNIYLCSGCLLNLKVCSTCRCKLEVGKGIDVDIPLALCTRLLALLNFPFENKSPEVKDVNSDGRQQDIVSVDGLQQSQLNEDSGVKNCENPKPSLSFGTSSDSLSSREGNENSGRSSKKRKMSEHDSQGGTENCVKKSKQEISGVPDDGVCEVMSPNTEKMVVAGSLLDLGNDPILFKELASESTNTRSEMRSNFATPSRPVSLTSDSSAFLTPASECKKPRRTPVRSSSERLLPSRRISGGASLAAERTTSNSVPGSDGRNTQTVATSRGRGRGARRTAGSLPSTPRARAGVAVEVRSVNQKTGRKKDTVKKNKKGETELHIACIKGNLDLVRELVKGDIDLNERDNAGWTPLHEACNHGHAKIVELLLDHGADINATGGSNCTPLLDSVANNRLECVRILLERGADTNIRNDSGETPDLFAKTPEMEELLGSHAGRNQNRIPSMRMPRMTKSVRPEKVVITATGIERGSKSWLARVVEKLGWKLEENIGEEVTHVITSANENKVCQRTMKYMMAILMGKWIITVEWLKACEEKGDWVDEEGFEVSGCSNKPDGSVPALARSNHLNRVPGIFDNCNFFISNSIPINGSLRSELASLVGCGSGHLLSREPKISDSSDSTPKSSRRSGKVEMLPHPVPFHATNDSPFSVCSHFVIHESLPEGSTYIMVNRQLCKVTAGWIYDCISSLTLVH